MLQCVPKNMSNPFQAKSEHRLVVAITGASGAIYGIEFLKRAVRVWDKIWLTISQNASDVVRHELGLEGLDTVCSLGLGEYSSRVDLLRATDLAAAPSSGSCRYDGMVIVPCSMGTLGRVAHGISADLTSRIADVCLKEQRKLILVTRETPLSIVHIKNMLAAAEAGAVVMPASPGFYHNPESVQDMVDFITARIFNALGVEQNIMKGWREGV